MRQNKRVVEYWFRYYTTPAGHCSLCGNSGVVDTRGVKTAAGHDAGRENFCICPNGQVLRGNIKTIPSQA